MCKASPKRKFCHAGGCEMPICQQQYRDENMLLVPSVSWGLAGGKKWSVTWSSARQNTPERAHRFILASSDRQGKTGQLIRHTDIPMHLMYGLQHHATGIRRWKRPCWPASTPTMQTRSVGCSAWSGFLWSCRIAQASLLGNRLFHVACQNGNKRICKLARGSGKC